MNSKQVRKSWKWRLVKAGRKQKDLAEITGIPQSMLSQYMNLRINPSMDKYDLIEEALQKMGV